MGSHDLRYEPSRGSPDSGNAVSRRLPPLPMLKLSMGPNA
jgi:hypothetical protein